ncbi:hypothetical protein RchiOBHm_Chr1g0327511 [Rosa chinensis]|uniref:Uncharacterized protein n=1 Tax=Rosa chinensis TaxID=74649 RepID=A0A2P6SAL2_ROSCH|nr:hypothetical protein RchiOBHm_Chr1g0327511 [Rosa chinensis]
MKYDQGSREMLVERGSLKYLDLNYFPRHHTSLGTPHEKESIQFLLNKAHFPFLENRKDYSNQSLLHPRALV